MPSLWVFFVGVTARFVGVESWEDTVLRRLHGADSGVAVDVVAAAWAVE